MCRFGAFLRVQRKWSPPATELIRAVDVSGGRNTFAHAVIRSHKAIACVSISLAANRTSRKTLGDSVCNANDRRDQRRRMTNLVASYLAIGTAMM
jgi:hypothetical protein